MRIVSARLSPLMVAALAIFLTTIFPIHAAGATEKVLHQFAAYPPGNFPDGLVADAHGNLYGTARGGLYNQGVVYQLVPNSKGNVTQTVLYNFTGGLDGGYATPLALDSAGNIYGFTAFGGTGSYGVFYELTPTRFGEWKETVLYNFTSTSDQPFATGPSLDAAGNFYGQTYGWGPFYGEIYQLSKSSTGTWSEKVLYTFTGGSDGGAPFGTFVFDVAGNLYGTGAAGGSGKNGVVFELSPASSGTWTETVLHNFTAGEDGSTPEWGVIFDSAGNLYGATQAGGSAAGCTVTSGCGTVFELQPSSGGGWTESVLYSFGNPTEYVSWPNGLAMDSHGNIFGTTYGGGTAGICYDGCGTLYELSPAGNGQWTETVLYNFPGPPGGYAPVGSVLFDPSGRLFGTTSLGGATELNGTIFESTLNSNGQWKTKTAYAFPTDDGYASQATLIADAEGNLYGTAPLGGTNNEGIVFELERASGWTEKILYNFDQYPGGQLVMDAAGNLYGGIYGGVFQLSPSSGSSWTEKTIAFFSTTPSGLVFDAAGNLYGTLDIGGRHNLGEVFELTPSSGTWKTTVLHTFKGYPTDGGSPQASLVFDSAGNLYGTTTHGGISANCVFQGKVQGCGTVFELSPTTGEGWNETILYSFTNSGGDGEHPTASVILDGVGNIYGTTKQGGIKGNCNLNSQDTCGTVFELSPLGSQWTETVLHTFGGTKENDGAFPQAGLVMDTAGNLFGTTAGGGTFSNSQYTEGLGTVFELSSTASGWTESILHDFGSLTDGAFPQGALFIDGTGRLYGTTAGTANGGSTAFEIIP